jgi:hypothetical protein
MSAPPTTPDVVPGSPVRPPRLRSPLARAVVPVLGGIAVIGAILLATWGMAVVISRGDAESTERLVPTEFQLGNVERWSETIAEDGPFILADLNTDSGLRSLVVDHVGDDPTRGWAVYWAYPADRDPSCEIEQVRGTRAFVDCDEREIDVTDLMPPEGVRPRIDDRTTLTIDLRADDAAGPATTG